MPSKTPDLSDDFVQLSRIALAGRPQDIQLLIHRASKKYQDVFPQMTNALIALLQESPSRSSPLRKQMDTPLPVDIDTRLKLLKVETIPPEVEPIFSNENEKAFNQILAERRNSGALLKHGLHPTKSMLFTGPPGLGKTLAARWLAAKLNRPLLILDLAAVMSSYLGRTGNNIRFVLDYAKNMDCVLLIDELDAIAKRRDDGSEVGELKRLVTVLLQEIDDWPPSGLLLAATNHPNLLDPAIWRRFEVVLDFKIPERSQIEELVKRMLNHHIDNLDLWSKMLSYIFAGSSFSDIERRIMLVRKLSAIKNTPLTESIQTLIISNGSLTHEQRVELACLLNESGIVSQRRAQEITGIARDTIRKYTNEGSPSTKEEERALETKTKSSTKSLKKKVKL